MNKLFTWALLALFCMASMTACNRDHDMGVQPESQLVSKNTTPRLYAIKQVGVATKAVSVKGKTWEPGATIRIKFLNGSGAIQSKVQQYAALWLEHANVKFEYVATSQEADVKIGFEWGNEDDLPFIAWSTTGTDARLVPQTEASLNFVGLEDDLSDEVFIKGEVLQAFGRILGLGFEHQAPQSPIVFKASSNTDKKKLEGYFGMSREQIMEQIIPLYTEAQSNHTEYDPTSIMALFLPKTILVSPENSVENNTELSELDKTFIAQLYPKVWLKHILHNEKQFGTAADGLNGRLYVEEFCGYGLKSLSLEGVLHSESADFLSFRGSIVTVNNILYFNLNPGSTGSSLSYMDESKVLKPKAFVPEIYSGMHKNGTTYLGTSDGIYYVNGDQFVNIPLIFRAFDRDYRLGAKTVCVDKNNRIYFGGRLEVRYSYGINLAGGAVAYIEGGELKKLSHNRFSLEANVVAIDGRVYLYGSTFGYVDENTNYVELLTDIAVAGKGVLYRGYANFKNDHYFFNQETGKLAKFNKSTLKPEDIDFEIGATNVKLTSTSKGIFLHRYGVSDLYFFDPSSNTFTLVKQNTQTNAIVEMKDGTIYAVTANDIWTVHITE